MDSSSPQALLLASLQIAQAQSPCLQLDQTQSSKWTNLSYLDGQLVSLWQPERLSPVKNQLITRDSRQGNSCIDRFTPTVLGFSLLLDRIDRLRFKLCSLQSILQMRTTFTNGKLKGGFIRTTRLEWFTLTCVSKAQR